MGILGIGVDVVHLPRIAALISRKSPDKFARRVLSSYERQHWQLLSESAASLNEKARFLGVRWSVKEAAYKALYPVIKPTWKELSYHPLANGEKPWLQFEPICSADSLKIGRIHISISHDGEYIYSSVLAEAPAGESST